MPSRIYPKSEFSPFPPPPMVQPSLGQLFPNRPHYFHNCSVTISTQQPEGSFQTSFYRLVSSPTGNVSIACIAVAIKLIRRQNPVRSDLIYPHIVCLAYHTVAALTAPLVPKHPQPIPAAGLCHVL